ncbi:hypothetical protein AU476_05280 [Cupriavidus sp. UYMSc13B]|nr:hypothetical protein AU476_05280 [Cupriavidus sp. UYMSc13B]
MDISLPDAVSTFFSGEQWCRASSLRRAFSEKAVVHDEGQTYQGHEAIETWLAEAQRKYAYSAEPLTFVQDAPASLSWLNMLATSPEVSPT